MLGYFHRYEYMLSVHSLTIYCRTGSSGAPQDHNLARKYYEQAAGRGHREAQHNLGAMYWSGDGVPVDAVLAVSWFKQAADKGNASSQLMLGLAHLHNVGFEASEASPQQALKFLKLAAESGDDTKAMFHLGTLYMNGVQKKALDGESRTTTDDSFALEPNLKLAIRFAFSITSVTISDPALCVHASSHRYLNQAARRRHAEAKINLEIAMQRKAEQDDGRGYIRFTESSTPTRSQAQKKLSSSGSFQNTTELKTESGSKTNPASAENTSSASQAKQQDSGGDSSHGEGEKHALDDSTTSSQQPSSKAATAASPSLSKLNKEPTWIKAKSLQVVDSSGRFLFTKGRAPTH
jgi:hypothetical protein